ARPSLPWRALTEGPRPVTPRVADDADRATACRRCRLRRIIRHVPPPTIPSACRPWRRWKRLTARTVPRPYTPSAPMCSARWRLSTELPRSPWCSVGRASAVAARAAGAIAQAASSAPARRRVEVMKEGFVKSARRLRGELTGSRPAIAGRYAAGWRRFAPAADLRPQWVPRSPARRARRLGAKRPSSYQRGFLLFAGSLAGLKPAAGASGDGLGPEEPAPALADDEAVLLEAQEQEAHMPARQARALGELARGEAGLGLERARDGPDAVEHLGRRAQGGHVRAAGPVLTATARC